MDCREFRRLLDASRAGRLTRYGRALLDWHRARCPRCAALAPEAPRDPAYGGIVQSKGTYV